MLHGLHHERGFCLNDAGSSGDCDGGAGHFFAPFVTVQQADIRAAMLIDLVNDQERVLRSISEAIGNKLDSIVPLEAKIDHAMRDDLHLVSARANPLELLEGNSGTELLNCATRQGCIKVDSIWLYSANRGAAVMRQTFVRPRSGENNEWRMMIAPR
jgi:hypothetical protein